MRAVYERQAFQSITAGEIRSAIERDGWTPSLIAEPPGAVYPRHRHAAAKLLVFLDGEMEVRAGGDLFSCQPGDRLIIPGLMEHEAKAGLEGCRYFWSEQIRGVG